MLAPERVEEARVRLKGTLVIDVGGCRCQAFALTGDAGNTDPASELSFFHKQMFDAAVSDAASGEPDYIYRRIGGGPAG